MDHYKTLGVSKSATQDEIKAAFRKLAAKHHPDAGGNEAKFKEIGEAYDTLKDPKKRAEYDNPNPFGGGIGGGHRGGFHYDIYTRTVNIDDLFAEMMRGAGGARGHAMRNPDITIAASISLAEAIEGKELIANYRLRTGRTETVNIRIPPGVHENTTMRYPGLGDEGIQGAQRGDLFVKVVITPERNWERQGDDLITSINVDALDMITGCDAYVTTLEKKNVKIKIPVGTKSGTLFGVTGHGMPNVNNQVRGRLLVRVNADIPKIQSTELLEKLRALKEELSH